MYNANIFYTTFIYFVFNSCIFQLINKRLNEKKNAYLENYFISYNNLYKIFRICKKK